MDGSLAIVEIIKDSAGEDVLSLYTTYTTSQASRLMLVRGVCDYADANKDDIALLISYKRVVGGLYRKTLLLYSIDRNAIPIIVCIRCIGDICAML